MFGDPAIQSDGHSFGECADKLIRGPFGSALKKEFFVSKGENTYKVYEQKHAIEDREDIGTYYIDEKKFQSLKRFEVKTNDIIMSCSGTIGRTHKITDKSEKGIINQALLLIRLNKQVCDETFFMKQMSFIVENLSTSGSAIVNISSVKVLSKMNFLLPPINKQKEYAQFVRQIDKSKFVCYSKYFLCDNLTFRSSTIAYSNVVSILECPNKC